MSYIKERILGAISVMNDKDAEKVWQMILATFALSNADEVEATPDELGSLKAYQNGDPDFQPALSHNEVIKELGLKKTVLPCWNRTEQNRCNGCNGNI